MFSESLLLAWLCTKVNLNKVKVNEIFNQYENLGFAVEDNFAKLGSPKWLERWPGNQNYHLEVAKFQSELENYDMQIVTFLDNTFPKKLNILDDLPIVLYYQGNLDLVKSQEMITVVGSRKYSKYSEIVMNQILKPACQAGIGVVSGLALGIDGLSHKIALDNKAPTIAVIGSGINDDVFYPVQNLTLKKQIVQNGGLVLSEYPPQTKATVYNFPRRNRILAALSEITWIVQASLKSGTLITSGLARDLGKTVATTPASILEDSYFGNLELIKNGANIISEYQDILQLLGLSTYSYTINTEADPVFDNKDEERVYQKLNLIPQNIEDISRELGFSTNELSVILSLLELSGLAQNIGENQWIKA